MYFRILKNIDFEVKIFFIIFWFLLFCFKNGLYIGLEKKIRVFYDLFLLFEGFIIVEFGLFVKEMNY